MKNSKMINAMNNPFRSEEIEKIKFIFDENSMEELMCKLEKYDYKASITGNHGSGKTHLLSKILTEFQLKKVNFKHVFLNEEKRMNPVQIFRLLKFEGILIIDGAEQIDYFQWKLFLFILKLKKGQILVTSHEKIGLPVLYNCETNLKLLKKIQSEICPELKINNEEYFEKHRGNIREILREYYDVYAGIY